MSDEQYQGSRKWALDLGLPDVPELDEWLKSVRAFIAWREQTQPRSTSGPQGTVFNEDFFRWWFAPQTWRGVVLDIGCGGGAVEAMIEQDKVKWYYGIDPLIAGDLGWPVRHLQAVGESLPAEIRDGMVDIVACCSVFQHCFSPEKVAAEAFRVLRAGGVFYATVCTGPASELNYCEFPDGPSVDFVLAEAGFAIRRSWMFERGLYAVEAVKA